MSVMRIVRPCPVLLLAVSASLVTGSGKMRGEEHGRAVSSHVADLLARARPPYRPAVDQPTERVPPLLQRAGVFEPDADIVRLTPFVVTGRYIPPPSVVDPGAASQAIQRKRLGSAYGLDRAVLNRFTIADFWRKIPILGKRVSLAGSTSLTNSQRAGMLEGEDARARRKQDFLDVTGVTKGASGAKQDRELRKQIQEALSDPRYR